MGAIQPGERSAVRDEFERFARRVSPSLLRSGYLLTGDRGHAEDLLQATLLRCARRWQAIARSPEAYAHRALVNLSRDRRRWIARRVVEVPHAQAARGWTSDMAERSLERERVSRAIRGLPRRQREVVVLRFFLELSVAETAYVMGASEGTVKSHTSRALARLRAVLGEPTTAAYPSEVPDGH